MFLSKGKTVGKCRRELQHKQINDINKINVPRSKMTPLVLILPWARRLQHFSGSLFSDLNLPYCHDVVRWDSKSPLTTTMAVVRLAVLNWVVKYLVMIIKFWMVISIFVL